MQHNSTSATVGTEHLEHLEHREKREKGQADGENDIAKSFEIHFSAHTVTVMQSNWTQTHTRHESVRQVAS